MVEGLGVSAKVPSGSLFIAITPERLRYYYPREAVKPWEFSWMNIYGALAISLWGSLRAQFGIVVPMSPDSEAGSQFLDLLGKVECQDFRDPFDASARAYAFFCTLFRQLASPSSSQLGPVEMALKWLETKSAARVTVKELAAVSGISREHFSRLFLASQGCAPALWLRNQRLAQARALLASTAVPISEVAIRCGFSSARHLRNAFRERFGKLPSASRLEQESQRG